jgi:hypothetical protein
MRLKINLNQFKQLGAPLVGKAKDRYTKPKIGDIRYCYGQDTKLPRAHCAGRNRDEPCR